MNTSSPLKSSLTEAQQDAIMASCRASAQEDKTRVDEWVAARAAATGSDEEKASEDYAWERLCGFAK